LHDSGIVYTVNNHFFNSGFLESFLFLNVAWNLLCGSGGCECTWKTDDDNVLSSAVIRDVDLFGVRKSLEKFHRGKGC